MSTLHYLLTPYFLVFLILAIIIIVACYFTLPPLIRFLIRNSSLFQRLRSRISDPLSENPKKLKLLIDIGANQANVLALLLISIVGAGQISIEIWRLNSDTRYAPPVLTIDEILKSKLVDPSGLRLDSTNYAINQQTKAIEQLNKTLEGKGTLGPVTVNFPERQPSFDSWTTALWIVAAVIAISVIGFFIEWLGNSKDVAGSWKFYVRLGAIISSLTLISVTNLTLFQFNFGSRHTEPAADNKMTSVHEISIILPEPRTHRTEIDCGFTDDDGTNVMRVASFPEGWASPNDKIEKDKDNAQMEFKNIYNQLNGIAEILKPPTGVRLVGVMLIGAAEKTRLKPYLSERLGANAGLALERAVWVKGELLKRGLALKPSEIVVLGSDPGNIRIRRAPSAVNEFNLDRAVQVCAFWERQH